MRRCFIYCLVVIMALTMVGCNIKEEDETAESVEETAVDKSDETTVEEESEDQEYYSKLTGLPISEEDANERPLAVMLNNIEAGCPQVAISQASIVYEAPVEGRITRLMGIFENYEDIEEIGSVRSSRDYFVFLALEYDAMYVHFGQSTVYVGDLLNSDYVDNISGNLAGIDEPAVNAFYRTTDRVSPHNVFVTSEGILEDIEKLGYETTYDDTYEPKLVFADAEEVLTYDDEPDATVLYPGGKENNLANGYSLIEARFEYNEETNLYERFQYGDVQIDELTGEQITYTNVIFQYCHGEIRDAQDYLAFQVHGDEGYKVQVFTNGKMVEGTWIRMGEYQTSPALYYDEDGEPIELNVGNTWVCIIWDEYGDDVVIE